MENKGRATTSVLTALLLVLSALLPILAVLTTSAVGSGNISTVGNFEQSGVFVMKGEAPPTSADLAFDNDTAPTNTLANIATSLHNNPLQIFLYVRNSIYFEPYEGSMKGAYQTYATLSGNDVDQANLLISLLRLSGIPARYVMGEVVLTLDEAENWVGFSPMASSSANATLTMANQTAKVLMTAGIPFQIRYGDTSNASSTLFTVSHIWVEAYVNSTWIQMDPSYKQYQYYVPVDWSNVASPETRSLLADNSSDVQSLLNYFNDTFSTYLLQNTNLKVGNVTAGNRIINTTMYSLPKDTYFASSTPSLTDSLRWFVGVSFPRYDPSTGAFTFTDNYTIHLPTTLLGTSHLSVYGLPDNSTLNYIKGFAGGIYDPSIDLTKVSLRPSLLFAGENLITGDECPFGSVMPVAVVTLLNNTIQQTGVMHYTVGQYSVIVTSLGQSRNTNDEDLTNALTTYNTTAISFASGQRVSLDNLLGERLLFTGDLYFGLANDLVRPMEGYLRVVQVDKVSVASVAFTLDVMYRGGQILSASPGGFTLDVFLNAHFGGVQLQANSSYLKSFNLLDGYLSSYIEGVTVGAQDQGVPISTASLLYYASQAQIPIVVLTPQNFTTSFPQLNLPNSLFDELSPFINQGLWVEIPSRLISTSALRLYLSNNPTYYSPTMTWNGTAYIVFDPQTFSGGYYISGVLTSGIASSETITLTGGQTGVPGVNAPYFSGLTSSQDDVVSSSGEVDAQCSAQSNAALVANPQETGPSCCGSAMECSGVGQDEKDIYGQVNGYNQQNEYAQGNRNAAPVMEAAANAVYGWDDVIDECADLNVGSCLRAGQLWVIDFNIVWNQLSNQVKNLHQQPISPLSSSGLVESLQSQPGPQLDLYLSDNLGQRSGFGQEASTTVFLTQYYNANASSAQLFLYEVPPGSYDISIVNSGTSSTSTLGELVTSSGSTSEQLAFGPVAMGPNTTMRAPLSVSYDNGVLTASIGNFLPASFVVLQRPNEVVNGRQSTINGRLTGDTGDNSLASKLVTLSYRKSGSITSDWVTLGTTYTSSGGTFSFEWNVVNPSVSPVGMIDFQAIYPGNSSSYQSSATVTTFVVTLLTVHALHTNNAVAGVNISMVGALGARPFNITGSDGEASFLVPESSYQIMVPAIELLASGSRAVFINWSDGIASVNRTINLNAPTDLTSFFELQSLVTANYSVSGGGNPTPPILFGVSVGSRVTYTLNETSNQVWLDNGSQWSTPALLRSGTALERWITSNATNGMVSAAFTLSLSYQHQDYVGTKATIGGLVSPSSGWYDAGQTLQISASPDEGWKLGIWNALGSGSYAGGSNSATLTVSGPINQTAVFYPGLTIQVSGSGSVQYSYGGTSGTVNSGNTTIYVPPGANVQLSASPSFLLYQFSGWSGATTSKSGAVSLSLDSPLSAQAVFSFDYLNLSIIAVIAIVTLLIGSMVVMRRTRGGSGPTAPSTATQTAPTPPPPLQMAAGSQSQDLLCPTCHNPIVKGEPFCPTCGTKLGSGQNFCRRCGHPVSPQALFCNQCGNRLS